MRTAVVILNWNTKEFLERFLPCLSASMPEGAEVVVADNGSTDGSVEVMREKFPDIKLICFDKNYGFTGGYNRAFKALSEMSDGSDMEYFVLINSDIEVPEGWLEPLVSWMDTHPDCAACAPKLHSWQDKDSFEYAGAAGGLLDKFGYPFCRGRIFDTVEKDNGQYNEPASVMWATGAALMVRSADFHSGGGLDPKFFAHMEEIDFCWRLRSRGRGIVCIPDSKVFHVGGGTLPKNNPFKTFLNFRNNLLMLYKNVPDDCLKRIMIVRFWFDMLAILVFALKMQMGDAKAVIKARKEFKKLRKTLYKDIRKQNMALATNKYPAEWWNKSLLKAYHLNGKKTFSELNFK